MLFQRLCRIMAGMRPTTNPATERPECQRRAAKPIMRPVVPVKIACAKGDMTPRRKKICARSLPGVLDSAMARPKYRMFSVKAKPPAIVKAKTTPSTGPSKCRRAISSSRSRPRDLANSSTTGAWTVVIKSRKDSSLAVGAARAKTGWINRVTAMDTAAPHVKANTSRRFGSGSQRSITRTERSTAPSGISEATKPTAKPVTPVFARRKGITRNRLTKARMAPITTRDSTPEDGRAATVVADGGMTWETAPPWCPGAGR
jgi:hypothetical protein